MEHGNTAKLVRRGWLIIISQVRVTCADKVVANDLLTSPYLYFYRFPF